LQRADINKNSKNSKNSRKHRAPENDSPKSGPSCLFLLSPPISPAVATHLTTYQPTTNTHALSLSLSLLAAIITHARLSALVLLSCHLHLLPLLQQPSSPSHSLVRSASAVVRVKQVSREAYLALGTAPRARIQ